MFQKLILIVSLCCCCLFAFVTATPNSTTLIPPATTAFPAPTNIVTYAPLPPDWTQVTIPTGADSNVPSTSALQQLVHATSLHNISEIIKKVAEQNNNAASMPQPKLFVPLAGLGSFVVKSTSECGNSNNLHFRSEKSATAVTIFATSTGTATDVAFAVRDCVIFNPSSATLQNENISKSSKFLGVQISVGDEVAQTALELSAITFNAGPQTNPRINCSEIIVPRGARFYRDLGFVFLQKQGLLMVITATSADLFPLPLTIRVTSNSTGFISVRGVLSDSAPLSIVFTASDTYRIATATCTIQPIYIPLHFANPMTEPFQIGVGVPFVFAIPNNMFVSSSPFQIVSVLQKDNYPLPPGVKFQPPNQIVGVMPWMGLFNWTVTAADSFDEATGYILINSVSVVVADEKQQHHRQH